MRRNIFIALSCLLILAATLLLRHQMIASSAKFFLTKALSESFSCNTITSSEGRISIEGGVIKKEQIDLAIENASFSVNFKEVLLHPKALFNLLRKSTSHWSSYLAAMKEYGVDLNIENGILLLDGKQYFFNFESGGKKREIGTLKVFLDPRLDEYPSLLAQFHMRGDQLISQFRIGEVESEPFFQLGALAFPGYLRGYRGREGTVQMHASVTFEKDGQIDEIFTRFKSSDLKISIPHKELELGAKNLKGELNYPKGLEGVGLPTWEQMSCNLLLEEGWVDLGSSFKFRELSGTLGLDPGDDPSLFLTGNFDSDAKTLAVNLKGRKAAYEDPAYWLEFDLNLKGDHGTLCNTLLSISLPEPETHVIQLEATDLMPTQVEMLKGYFAKALPALNHWSVLEGTFGGKFLALFEKGALSHFELQEMRCEKVSLLRGEAPFYFFEITGGGRLFEELSLSFLMPTSHFFGLASESLRQVYKDDLPDDYIELTSTIDFLREGVETSATVAFPLFGEAIHFGFTSPTPFPSDFSEIEKGWARSERITQELYAPFIRIGSEDVKLLGDVDLVGTYDGKKVELALQIDHCLARHPLIDLKADHIGEKGEIVGRVSFEWDPQTRAFGALIPLKGASVYERSLGLVGDKLDATLRLENGKLLGEVENGVVIKDNYPLLKKVRGQFAFDGEISINMAKGLLPFETDREFILALNSCSPKGCFAQLFEAEEEIATLDLCRGKDWSGKLSTSAMGDLDITFNWDLMTKQCQLTASNEKIHLSGRKEGIAYLIDTLDTSGLLFSGAFSKGDEGFDLTSLHVQRGNLSAEARGTFQVDLPKKESPFGIRSELHLVGKKGGDVPLGFETAQPLRCAFSSVIGWIFTDVSLTSGGSTAVIEHLEYLMSKKKTVAYNVQFHLTKALCDQVIQAGVFPPLLSDFRIHEGLGGLAHFEWNPEEIHFTSTLNTPICPLKAELKWRGGRGTLALGDERKLLFNFHQNERDAFFFDEISGELGSVQADLKSNSKGGLRGKLQLDFSLFNEIFNLPLNHYLAIWKAGGGYTFEGTFIPAVHFADWAFKGKIKGSDFEWGGYTVRSMEAKVEIEPEQVAIENLDITDDAGKAWVSEGAIIHSENDWIFAFPLIEIRSFQPSFLRKRGRSERAITPLIVKTATLRGVRGCIDDPKSVIASGSLKFTNISKKGGTCLPNNLPIAVLHSMGLNGSLFVPASGEIDYTIRDGRCYLRAISNVISEKGYSEFIPPSDGMMGYIDFDGKVDIDMQIRQSAVPSISEPINVKIRGNFEDPEVFIQ